MIRKEGEGGCGVIGLACSEKVEGRHVLLPSQRMHNRGNGKGGGIAAVGLDAEQMRVSREVLENDYLIQVAYLDPTCREEVERRFVRSHFEVDQAYEVEDGGNEMAVRPPKVWRYFVRVRVETKDPDRFVYENSRRLNEEFYATLGRQRAFVLCHGKDMIVFKAVGYAEECARFYRLEGVRAHVWIAHQRYPTKGKVWHPGGAHPFIGLHEALVHNGDLANYHSIVEFLEQRGIRPQFQTDTEVAALLFDYYRRQLGYPLEYVIEALAPTTDLDFERLPEEKRRIYRAIQAAHIHGSPDGPWFFILARRDPEGVVRLIGITDTSMLRPQVFALYRGRVSIGLVASEKQAIDAALESLSEADGRFCPVADRYWSARGGSHTDGGAFVFSVDRKGGLTVTDKFGREVKVGQKSLAKLSHRGSVEELTRMHDRWEPVEAKRSHVLASLGRAIKEALDRAPNRIEFGQEAGEPNEEPLVIDASVFPPEGKDGVAHAIRRAYEKGWRRFIVYGTKGHRFIGCGLGLNTHGVRIDVYGSPGDYLGSGLDGGEIHVHGSAQDQVGQILRRGKLVIHGDVGQTFMYGAKGGEVYVLGNAAGRPLINAVGRPRVVINGTCLDYLAESFMAGDPLRGGGFVVVNALVRDEDGRWLDQEEPYPGGTLFSLASGGAIYIRDPEHRVLDAQLNGGRFADMSGRDWALIRPYLEENERLFGITIERLLGGRRPEEVYRKVEAVKLSVLAVPDVGE